MVKIPENLSQLVKELKQSYATPQYALTSTEMAAVSKAFKKPIKKPVYDYWQ